jgi:hypothetical protein
MNSLDKQKIKQFIEVCEKVKNSRFVKETKNVTFNLSIGVGKPLEQNLDGFDEDNLRSMLIDLRKFTLKKDNVYILDICDFLILNTTNQDIILNLQKCKNNYLILLDKPIIKMIINNEVETGWDVIRKWFYGHYFHEDQEKQNMQNLGFIKQMHKFSFVNAITELIGLCSVVANNAKLILDNDN